VHSIWSGSISFGLVNIPVKLYAGAEDHELHFTLLHKKDKSPIRYLRVCKADGKEVPYKDIVKGYEFKKDEFIEIDEKDFEKANPRATHSVDIIEFVNENEVDIRYFQKPYYLEPVKADKPYALLREALLQSKKVAIAKVVLRNREHLAMIKVVDNVLVLDLMRFESEIKKPKNLEVPDAKIITNTKEVDMAMALIKQLTRPFKGSEFHDTYTEELEKVIEAKIAGKKTRASKKPLQTTKMTDLMETLKKSLAKSKSTQRRRRV
jgi:DNA end-binding protein Ku